MSNVYKPPTRTLQQYSYLLTLIMKLIFAFLLVLGASATTQALYLDTGELHSLFTSSCFADHSRSPSPFASYIPCCRGRTFERRRQEVRLTYTTVERVWRHVLVPQKEYLDLQ
ncbi:hypothetical protein EV421DRAFT_161793 [Armillaria borealis]|uniref:Uncharacterized protein n=1 Tax=Armillaria borealis TaxID=47425 RepID=A0AA39MVX2_9AGAR|nr:hypothetical protein EV421DRAFT_161793 [Armillaria borealis]